MSSHTATIAANAPAKRNANIVLVARVARVGPIVLAARLLSALALLVEISMVGTVRANMAEPFAALVIVDRFALPAARNFCGIATALAALVVVAVLAVMLSRASRLPSLTLVPAVYGRSLAV